MCPWQSETCRQDKNCGEQNSRFPARDATFSSHAEIHFPSVEALQACAASEGGKQTIANAVAISSGGPPIFLVAEEEVLVFQGK